MSDYEDDYEDDYEELLAVDHDFAEYGCEGTGEYSRCSDMSDRFEALFKEVLTLRDKVERVEALADEWAAEFRREWPRARAKFKDARVEALRTALEGPV